VDIEGISAAFHKVPFQRPRTDRFFFKGRKAPFRVDTHFFRCPDCNEEEVDLCFWEESSKRGAPLVFQLTLATKDFKGEMPPEGWEGMPREARPLAKEVLDNFPKALRERLRQALPYALKVQERIDSTWQDYELGQLDRDLVYSEVLVADPRASSWGDFGFRFDHDGRTYLIKDIYLSSLDDDVYHVVLDFYLVGDGPNGKERMPRAFRALLHFSGVAAVHAAPPMEEGGALELLAHWLAGNKDLGTVLWDRLDQVLDFSEGVLQKIYEKRDQELGPPEEDAPATGDVPWFEDDLPDGDQDEVPRPGIHKEKVGRNDPCPCGSGKKYKKCCGGPWGIDKS